MLKNKNGFTLSELMAVIICIGILAAIALPSYKTSVMKTKIVNNMPLMKALQNDMANYYALHETLPTKLTQLSINKKEFRDLSDTSGTHIATKCTLTLGVNQRIGISMNCGQGWTMFYSLQENAFGYSAGEKTIQVTNSSDANSIRKIAAGFKWPQKSGSDNTYIIQ